MRPDYLLQIPHSVPRFLESHERPRRFADDYPDAFGGTVNGDPYANVSTAQAAALINAIRAGTVVEAYMIGESAQTKAANGGSVSGWGYCTAIDGVVNPGAGNQLVPRSDVVTGAPCTSDGRIWGKGLELTISAPIQSAWIGGADMTADQSVTPTVPNNLFADPTCGLSWFSLGKLRGGSIAVATDDGSGTNAFNFLSDAVHNFELLADPRSNIGNATTYGGGGSTPMLYGFHMVTTQQSGVPNGNFSYLQVGRSGGPWDAGKIAGTWTGARRLRILDDTGTSNPATGANGDLEWYGGFLINGSLNAAQARILNDWAASWMRRKWGLSIWEDRRDVILVGGDSWKEPLNTVTGDGVSHLGHITRGFEGAAQIDNCTILNVARSGNNVAAYQYGMVYRWAARMDWSYRVRKVCDFAEYLNGSTPTQNYALASAMQGIGFVVGTDDNVYDSAIRGSVSTINPDMLTELHNNGVAGGHFSCVIRLQAGQLFNGGVNGSPYGDGTNDHTTGKSPLWFVVDNGHPESQTQFYFVPFRRRVNLISLGYLTRANSQAVKVDPNVDFGNLTVGGAAITPVWTPKLDDGTVLAGDIPLASTSLNTGIVTVNSVTGEITPVGAGSCLVRAVAPHGGTGQYIVYVAAGGGGADPNASLLAHLTLNSDFTDSSGNGNNFSGTGDSGGPTFVTGRIGNAASLVKTSHDLVTIADSTVMRPFRGGQTGFAVAIPFKASDLFGATGGGVTCLGSKDAGSAGTREWFLGGTAGNGNLLWQIYASDDSTVATVTLASATWGTGTWFLVFAYVDLAGKTIGIKVYNVQTQTLVTSGSASYSGTPNPGSTAPVRFGGRASGDNFNMSVLLDDIRLYTALPAAGVDAALEALYA